MRQFPRVLARWAHAHRRLFVATIIVITAVMWTGAVASAWLFRDVVTGLPGGDQLQSVSSMAQATTLVDIKGRTAFTIFEEQRIDVPLDRVSPNLRNAVLAIEDQRFYDHGGVDVVRVAGAAWHNLRSGRTAQGASTITQQLARQSFLTPDKTMRRKLKEVVLAARLEKEFSKDEILELYLNKVYFGDGLYGVEAASLGYFGKHAAQVSVEEAALLAGLVKSPSSYAPTVSPARAKARRNVVLASMRDAGFIDRQGYETAVKQPVVLHDALREAETYGQYFKEEVRRQLVEQFGWERVYQGGLKVYTTLDLDMQRLAEDEVKRGITQIEERKAKMRARPSADPLQAALVALDPATGEVRAIVGGRDFGASHFNRATQAKRQPGSAFKPFVYAAAIEQGYSPATLISNLDSPIYTVQGAWVPEDEHLESPSITMRTALRTSSNRAAAQMLQQVGIDATATYAERLGLGKVPRVPSLALGSGEVTLMSMTSAFGAFANNGVLRHPELIRRVEGADGVALYLAPVHEERAVSEATAFIVSSMMADVINAGTAWQSRQLGFTLPAAGKTGTTNEYRDAWFVGFTPHLVTGVWVGYDNPQTIIRGGYAAELAVPMWSRFMAKATKGDEPDWLRAPATVTSATVCRLSGKLATDGCNHAQVTDRNGNLTVRSQVYTEYFVNGTEPQDFCPLHGVGGGFWNAIATSGTMPIAPPPVVGAPPPPMVATDAASTVAAPPAEPAAATTTQATERRRGFWSRVFGRGGDDRKENEPPQPAAPRR